jgi:chromodomain-helicase-DNA-binding protein 9
LCFIPNRWGRWDTILLHSGLRKGFTAKNIEDACRLTLLYCLNLYRGDEKIKSFVWDLITPEEYGGDSRVSKNHSGLSGPIPRGRKGKKMKRESSAFTGESIAWVSDEKYDVGTNLALSYRKHLDRHNNKILLRIRMLYYIHHEILSDHVSEINTPGKHAR